MKKKKKKRWWGGIYIYLVRIWFCQDPIYKQQFGLLTFIFVFDTAHLFVRTGRERDRTVRRSSFHTPGLRRGGRLLDAVAVAVCAGGLGGFGRTVGKPDFQPSLRRCWSSSCFCSEAVHVRREGNGQSIADSRGGRSWRGCHVTPQLSPCTSSFPIHSSSDLRICTEYLSVCKGL